MLDGDVVLGERGEELVGGYPEDVIGEFAAALATVLGLRSTAVEKRVAVVCGQFRILVEEPVIGVGVDPQLGVRQVVCEQVAVLGDHHRVVVAVCDERRLRTG
jgi:hypothetical protein